MQDADFVMRTDPGLIYERSDLCVWVAGLQSENVGEQLPRSGPSESANLRRKSGVSRNASQGISAQETSAWACRRRRQHHHLANRCEPSRENKTGLNSNHVFFSSFYELLRRRDLSSIEATCVRALASGDARPKREGPDRPREVWPPLAAAFARLVKVHVTVVLLLIKSSQVKSSGLLFLYRLDFGVSNQRPAPRRWRRRSSTRGGAALARAVRGAPRARARGRGTCR